MHCEIVNAWIGVQTEGCNISVRNSKIDAVSIGINSIDASPIIENNDWIRAISDNALAGSVRAISLNGRSNPQILNNRLIEANSNQSGSAFGIWIGSATPVIEGNWIDASSFQFAVSIYAGSAESVRLQRNIIRAKSSTMMRGVWSVYSTVTMTSNDLLLLGVSDAAVGLLNGNGSTITMMNNIIFGNQTSVGDSTIEGRVDTSSGYNCYFNHASNHVGNWRGAHEVYEDPLFTDFGDDYNLSYYRLTRNVRVDPPILSPCIDAGSPDIDDPGDHPNDPCSDIGRWPVSYTPTYTAPDDPAPVANGFILHPAFPNPFNRTTQFSFELALPGPASVAVFDLNGRYIQSLWNGPAAAGAHHVEWSAEGLPAGEYLIRLDVMGRTQTSRVVYLP